MVENVEVPKVRFGRKNYVEDAEKVMLYLKSKDFKISQNRKTSELTSTQLRNLLSMTSSIYDITLNQGPDAAVDKLLQFKIQLLYQSGRTPAIKELVEVARLSEIVNLVLKKSTEEAQKELTLRLCHYMEALVAYFKYYGGKD